MHQLLRTYLIGTDRKYELYGDVDDAGEGVTKVLEYSFRSLNPAEKTAHWVCLGEVDISEYTRGNQNPAMRYQLDSKNNDIHSIRQLCKRLAMR
ncbi:hypothetical protein [Leclercia adecarboxylata]|uniref:hypothetical protein n=1 Tax=Leclercia adecarboxylata TaxID=83655 RepID=UPI001331454D|nr:hypothetical protein [Leclercia adecarboxylata]